MNEARLQSGQFNFSRSRGAAFGEKFINPRQQTLQLFAFRGLLLGKLSHTNEFILRAQVAGEWCVAIQSIISSERQLNR